jgi:hypothetical protein
MDLKKEIKIKNFVKKNDTTENKHNITSKPIINNVIETKNKEDKVPSKSLINSVIKNNTKIDLKKEINI